MQVGKSDDFPTCILFIRSGRSSRRLRSGGGADLPDAAGPVRPESSGDAVGRDGLLRGFACRRLPARPGGEGDSGVPCVGFVRRNRGSLFFKG